MAKSKKGFIWGLLIGLVVASAGFIIYQQYFQKTKFERRIDKIEKQANKELNKAKKLFE